MESADGAQFQAYGKAVNSWETPQSMDADSAIGLAIYAIDANKIKLERPAI